jgi:EAL domain-containing protein (putative c-di-GMP-specific phosphodiesterase class I)
MVVPMRMPRGSAPRLSVRTAVPRRPNEPHVRVVLQPIIDISTGAVIAAEALSRFPDRSGDAVEETLAAAHASGLGGDLEAACLRAALDSRQLLPPGVRLAVNVSPDALSHPSVRAALAGDLSGVIVEVTELPVADQTALIDELTALRWRGAAIAVDDASTGYAGLSRLAALRPDIVKLDRALVTGSRGSVERTAVIEAIVSLSQRLGSQVLGEGVESMPDLEALAALNVEYAQGLAIAPPAPALLAPSAIAVATCATVRRKLMRVPAQDTVPSEALATVTAALAGSMKQGDLAGALAAAAASLDVDAVGLSILDSDDCLYEIFATGAPVDPCGYALRDYPATRQALETGVILEAHADDPGTDPAEREYLRRHGRATVLTAPLIADGVALGILELIRQRPGRWRAYDVMRARTLADHVAQVLLRMRGAGRDSLR